MLNKKMWFYCALVFACCACSSDPEDTTVVYPPVNGDVEIVPTTNLAYVDDPGDTRAGGVIEPGAAISVSMFRADETYPTSWTGKSALPASVNTSGAVEFSTTQYYLASGSKTKLVGVYPAVGTGATWNATNGTMTYTIDGYTDIMATSIVEASKSSAQPELTFNHLLSQIEFTVLGEDATAIGLWGTVNSISVAGRPNSCVVTLPKPNASGAATATFSGSGTLPARLKNGNTPSATTVTTTEKTFGYCLLSPASSVALTLNVVTSIGGSVQVTLPAKIYEVGKAYKVQLKLTKTAINAKATISEWTPGGATITETL